MRSATSREGSRAARLVLGALAFTGLVLACANASRAVDPEPRILLQASPLAGFRHHAADAVWEALAVGDALDLVREPDNPHDRNAIRVDWRGHRLGYVPRRENAALAWALDRGERVNARIARLLSHPNPRERVRFEVFAE